MDESKEQGHLLRALAMRVAALEDNVAFLEEWCEEQQDALDRTAGPVSYDYEVETGPEPPPRALLRVVDLREVSTAAGGEDDEDADTIVALVETEHDRRVRQLQRQLNRLRTRLAQTLAPSGEDLPTRRVSAKQAGRTAP
jgi:uncharacterized coiled-coil protein SlyX